MLENESLEFQSEGEPIRHIRRMESLGFYDGRSGEYVIGKCIYRGRSPIAAPAIACPLEVDLTYEHAPC